MTTAHQLSIRLIQLLRSAVLWIGAALGTLCLVLFIAGLLFGIRPQAVLSGSMEPTLPTGSLILVRPVPVSEVSAGQIVTVPLPDGHGTVTHRVVGTATDSNGITSLTLKGDANLSNDPVPYPVATAGQHLLTLPYLGTLAMGLRSPFGLLATCAVAMVFLLTLWQPKAQKSPAPN
ncbi:signal peptidase I [Glutamicibacter endophyticus]|uniref:signal peptidase I n=1 Tax=Glutamicibacter endophyticus TaxID=1522174 RepID=UPI003AF15C0D